MADDDIDTARRALLVEIDDCLDRAFAQRGEGSGRIVERVDALVAAVRAEARGDDHDDRAYLWDRCYACGHRLVFDADSCPQCGIPFDGRDDPGVWPEQCPCPRCEQARTIEATHG